MTVFLGCRSAVTACGVNAAVPAPMPEQRQSQAPTSAQPNRRQRLVPYAGSITPSGAGTGGMINKLKYYRFFLC